MIELVKSGRSVESLAREFGCSGQSIRIWMKQHELDSGHRRDGLTSEDLSWVGLVVWIGAAACGDDDTAAADSQDGGTANVHDASVAPAKGQARVGIDEVSGIRSAERCDRSLRGQPVDRRRGPQLVVRTRV
jgi:hypothetical protein